MTEPLGTKKKLANVTKAGDKSTDCTNFAHTCEYVSLSFVKLHDIAIPTLSK